MLCFILQPCLIAQLPMAQAGQLLLVMGIAFAIITLISSTYRFHKMIQLTDEALVTVEDRNDFFYIQVTRYLSKINRISSGFGILIVQFVTTEADARSVQNDLLEILKTSVRNTTDKACLFRDDCVAAIIDTEEEHVPTIMLRMATDLKKAALSIPGIQAIRAGASSFPLNGLNTQAVIDAATTALETVSYADSLPLCMAPKPKPEDGQQEVDAIGELSKEDKNAALDPLTGVLKPAVVGSYMRKYLFEIRREKKPASLLCVGINRIDQIIKLHGEEAADDVIARISKILQQISRDRDLIGRYHRDDFMILMPCTLQQGEMIATRLREAVQKELFISGTKRIKTAVSIGITAMPEHGRNLRDLFRGAYCALEVVRGWNTTACLVYDPAQHSEKTEYATRR